MTAVRLFTVTYFLNRSIDSFEDMEYIHAIHTTTAAKLIAPNIQSGAHQ